MERSYKTCMSLNLQRTKPAKVLVHSSLLLECFEETICILNYSHFELNCQKDHIMKLLVNLVAKSCGEI